MTARRRSRFLIFLASRKYAVLLLIVGLSTLAPMIVSPSSELTDNLTLSTNMVNDWCLKLLAHMNDGQLTPRLALLPSILAYCALILGTFSFFSQRASIETASLGVLIMITFVGMQGQILFIEGGMIVLMFTVLSLYSLFLFYEDRTNHFSCPWVAALLAAGALSSHGVIALLVPILIFALYIRLVGMHTWRSFLPLLYYALIALVISGGWYWYERGTIPLAPELAYTTQSLLAYLFSFLPWGLLFFFMPWSKVFPLRNVLSTSSPYLVFSVLALTIAFLLSIIMPNTFGYLRLVAYPFAGLICAEQLFYMARDERSSLVTFTWTINTISVLIFIGLAFVYTGLLPEAWVSDPVAQLSSVLNLYRGVTVLLSLMTVVAILTTVYQSHRKSYVKLTYSSVFLVFTVLLSLETLLVLYSHHFGRTLSIFSLL